MMIQYWLNADNGAQFIDKSQYVFGIGIFYYLEDSFVYIILKFRGTICIPYSFMKVQLSSILHSKDVWKGILIII